MNRRNWKLLRQDSSGGGSFNAKLKELTDAEAAEKKRRREEQFAKEEEEEKIKSKQGRFSRELTKQLLLERKEKEGFFLTPTLDTKVTLMVMEENVEKSLEMARGVNEHLDWQRSIISRLEKQPNGQKLLENLREVALKGEPERVEDLLRMIDKRLAKLNQK